MKSIICIGEALIDFICTDINSSLSEGRNFLRKAGGAPANVAAAITKLGGSASFFGKVGADAFGKFLIHEMSGFGIDCSNVVIDEKLPTTLAFVSLKEDGERDFEFFRGADGELRYEDIDSSTLDSFDIYHFGSATGLLDGKLKETYMDLLKYAKNRGKVVSFDPNYRNLLWKEDTDKFISRVKKCLNYVDMIKLSDEEAYLIFGKRDLDSISKDIHTYGVKLVAITQGEDGAFISVNGIHKSVPTIEVTSIDSTGAGDAFVGAMLYKLSISKNIQSDICDIETMSEYTRFSNVVGAITCTKYGAMDAMPSLEQVEGLI